MHTIHAFYYDFWHFIIRASSLGSTTAIVFEYGPHSDEPMSSIANLNQHKRTHPGDTTRYLLVCSGRDGVGKSSVCTNLAIVLARSGKQVCILDTDPGVTNIHRLLDIIPAYTLADVASGNCTLRDAVNQGPGDIRLVLDGGHRQIFAQQNSLQQHSFLRQLQDWERGFDYIFIDTPASDLAGLDYFADVADGLLLVLAPEPAILDETFSLLCHLNPSRQKAKHIIVNKVSSAIQAKSIFDKFSSKLVKHLGNQVHYCGHIGLDDNIRNSFSLQHPVALYHDQDPSCAAFFKLAQALETQAHYGRQALVQALQNGMIESSSHGQEISSVSQDESEPARLPSSAKEQFMHTPTMADELIDSGLLNGLELRAIVDSLITTGKHEFPKLFAGEPSDAGPLPDDDLEDNFQQSLLGLLKQNRGTGKSLDQMLHDFLDKKH